MHRLIYTSMAQSLLKEDMLEGILNSARKNNSAAGISGLLIYHDGCFFQVLEGDEKQVQQTYQRIKRDHRHSGCIVLADEAVPSRLFGSWKMAYQPFREMGMYERRQFIDLKALAGDVSAGALKDHPKTQAILMAFLSSFRDIEIAA